MADIIDPLMPPYRFERVQPQLYRGGYPKPRNFRFLRRQRLKTIVSLIPDDRDNLLAEFCHDEGIKRIVIAVDSPNENVTVSESIVSRCLELVTNPDTMPLYLHCLDGSNVTGVVIMCLRKLQLWRVVSMQSEYLRFEQDGEIIPEESEFVETYSGRGLALPNPYVEWLWPGRVAALGGKYDVNVLPFKNNVHPVVPHTRLKQRMSTDICQADPRPVQSRSATDLASKESSEIGRGSEVMYVTEPADRPSSEGLFALQQHPLRTSVISDGQSTQTNETTPSLAMADVRTTHSSRSQKQSQGKMEAGDGDDQSQTTDQLSLHTSFSTGALPDMSQSTQHHHQQRTPMSDAHEVLEPVLAALAGEAMRVAAESNSPHDSGKTTKASTRSNTKPPLGIKSSEDDGSEKHRAADEVKGVSSRNSGTLAGISEGAVVKELSLSLLVQALAIEGLGM
ncbi:protein-tyrosine-phosphatase [Coemansia aciculifera]|uniref:Protein-tyrosine-phosphatase n=1 Tax=Coemansia aciculifera TaxID=417176 RepID=A0A9W8IHU2_9FUNG|nr:protein-tyrosine-phosphatase [Coemansia aciculifera]KAJ2876880.1 protein-tyrosine-phosphatase [Coemansia aciculifera]